MMKRLVIGVLVRAVVEDRSRCGARLYIAYQWLSQLAKIRVAALHRHLVGNAVHLWCGINAA